MPAAREEGFRFRASFGGDGAQPRYPGVEPTVGDGPPSLNALRHSGRMRRACNGSGVSARTTRTSWRFERALDQGAISAMCRQSRPLPQFGVKQRERYRPLAAHVAGRAHPPNRQPPS
jgi:hypothetical protein